MLLEDKPPSFVNSIIIIFSTSDTVSVLVTATAFVLFSTSIVLSGFRDVISVRYPTSFYTQTPIFNI